MEKGLILVHDGDDAAVALADLKAGEAYTVAGQTVLLRDPIPFGHKVALREIRAGENVVKYGNPLGHATQDIHVGQHIHTHNMATNLAGHIEYTYEPNGTSLSALQALAETRPLQAIRSPDGKAGVRKSCGLCPRWAVSTGQPNAWLSKPKPRLVHILMMCAHIHITWAVHSLATTRQQR